MGKRDNILMKLQVEKRIYDDSPQVTVTYKDLSRFIEHMIELTETDSTIGFKGPQMPLG